MQQFEHKDTNLCNYSPVTSFKITIKLFSFQAFDKENRMCHSVSASTSLLYLLSSLNISLNIFFKSDFYLE